MKHEIILGDCELKLKELLDSSIHLTWTSPPYYNAKSYSQWPTYDDYLVFLEKVFLEVFRITKEGRMCVVNLSPVIVQRINRNSESKRLPIPFHFFSIMEKIGWKYLEDILWVKPEGSAINRNGGFFQHRKPVAYKPNLVSETIFVFQKPANFLIEYFLLTSTLHSKHNALLGDLLLKSANHSTPQFEQHLENSFLYAT